jgi:O-methyltransferase
MRRLVNEQMSETMVRLAATRPAGAFVEVGVYQGGTAVLLYKVAQAQGREIFLFDTFAGMPVSDAGDVHKVGDFADTSYELVRAVVPNATLVSGVFPFSFVETGPVAFVHADADQYFSTLSICSVFAPRMVDGGMILFDDYDPLPGCRKAVDEFFADTGSQAHLMILEDGRALARFTKTNGSFLPIGAAGAKGRDYFLDKSTP